MRITGVYRPFYAARISPIHRIDSLRNAIDSSRNNKKNEEPTNITNDVSYHVTISGNENVTLNTTYGKDGRLK